MTIIAGPLGFYGSYKRIVLGPCRETKTEAGADAELAMHWLRQSSFAAPHVWRLLHEKANQ